MATITAKLTRGGRESEVTIANPGDAMSGGAGLSVSFTAGQHFATAEIDTLLENIKNALAARQSEWLRGLREGA
jgi:hypothetical protein